MEAETGLRERKKQRTRLLIADTARRLFAERGFEAVSVAEVARAAEVSEATVFNYFPTKEDLVFQGLASFETELLAAIRERSAGEGAVAAFGRFVLQARGFLAAGGEASTQELIGISRMIAASPALVARERQILARYAGSLAELLAEETGAAPGDLRPRVVADALIGVHAALIGYVRQRLVDEPVHVAALARDVQEQGEQALALLAQGMAGYAVKQP